jgi:trk system potassium uptake protein TrkA
MDLRVILVGGGRVGYHTARLLDDRGHSVVVIERNPERCERIADAYFATVIEGDGARPDVLRQADPGRADAIAGLTPNSGANFGACVLAMRMNPDIRTVVRVSTPEGAEGYEEVVDATVFPERAGARAAVNALSSGDIHSIEGLPGELEVAEIRVHENSPVAGRTLAAVTFPQGSLVLSDAEGDNIATSETVLEVDRSYLVGVEPEVADEVRQLFQG